MKISKGKLVTLTILAIVVTGFFMIRDAESAEIGLGLGYGTFNAKHSRTQEISIQSNDYRWFASYARIGAADNDRIRRDQTNRYTAAYRACFWRERKLTPCISMGAAYFDEPIMTLISDRLTYDIRIVVRWKEVLEFEIDQHNSTAGRSVTNSGLDSIMLRGVFRF